MSAAGKVDAIRAALSRKLYGKKPGTTKGIGALVGAAGGGLLGGGVARAASRSARRIIGEIPGEYLDELVRGGGGPNRVAVIKSLQDAATKGVSAVGITGGAGLGAAAGGLGAHIFDKVRMRKYLKHRYKVDKGLAAGGAAAGTAGGIVALRAALKEKNANSTRWDYSNPGQSGYTDPRRTLMSLAQRFWNPKTTAAAKPATGVNISALPMPPLKLGAGKPTQLAKK